jgi:multidrug resistance efflux pump
MTFISASDAWVEAEMRENSLGNIEPGDPVEIVLDVAPGRVFAGTVASIGYGVETGNDQLGALPSVGSKGGWLRDPQRFPVIIRFVGDATLGLRRAGGQADVVIYTGDHFILNALAWVWIRIVSWLSFIY